MNEIRVHRAAGPLDAQLLERFRHVSVSALSDSLERTPGAVGLHPVGDSLSSLGGRCMVGTAMTVRTRPGDNLAVHKALDLAEPGEILVIDARGEVVNAILGELMTFYAASRRIAGLVVDGAVRDRLAISAGTLPVYARGFSHLGPYKSGPGAIRGPVSVGGVAVHDGDVVVGDGDGVVFVPRGRAEDAVAAAETVMASESDQRLAIEAGRWDRSWIDVVARVVPVDTAG